MSMSPGRRVQYSPVTRIGDSEIILAGKVMSDFIFASFEELLTGPVIAGIIALSAAWNCYTGEVRFGDYLHFDSDDTGPFIILVGLKFVLAFLIILVCYGS